MPITFTPKRSQTAPLRVVFVRGPVVVFPASLSTHGPTPPIGIAYIAATLRAEGYPVAIVDSAGEGITTCEPIESPIGTLHRIGLSQSDTVDRIDPKADVIGFTNMFLHEWPELRRLIKATRDRFPDQIFVIGGENATAYWSTIIEECPEIDFVVRGEGENTMLELVHRVQRGDTTDDIAGLVSCRAARALRHEVDADGVLATISLGATNATPTEIPAKPATSAALPTRLRDLSSIPRPAWDLVPMHNYFENPFFGVDRGRSMPLLATRGCPYKCSFCSSPQMWTTRYVVREPEELCSEIATYIADYDIKNINFCDLTAITKRRWTLAFCDALDDLETEITWQLPVGTRAEALDEEVLVRLFETGCRNVTYAPESGSQRMLKVFDKRVDLDHILGSIKAAHRIGLRTHVNIILGHPAERLRDVAQSAWFLVKAAAVGCDDCAVILFCPYPGSRDFDTLKEAGRLDDVDSLVYLALGRSSSAALSFHGRFSSRTLRTLQLAMLAMFYGLTFVRQPGRLWAFISAQRTGEELTYLDQMVRTKRHSIRPRSWRRRTQREN